MEPQDAIGRIQSIRNELIVLPASVDTGEFESWTLRARSVLERTIGEDHHISVAFSNVTWAPTAVIDDEAFHQSVFDRARSRAAGILDAARAEIELMRDDRDSEDSRGVDVELWEHVSAEVQAQAWAKVASQATLFTEDRIRKWAGRPVEEVGKELAVAVFGNKGEFRMGMTDGEKQGWQFLAQGTAQAIRNADSHRIQSRRDHKTYALGVLGVCSLILTQMRYEHGNRFYDLSPVSSAAPQL